MYGMNEGDELCSCHTVYRWELEHPTPTPFLGADCCPAWLVAFRVCARLAGPWKISVDVSTNQIS